MNSSDIIGFIFLIIYWLFLLFCASIVSILLLIIIITTIESIKSYFIVKPEQHIRSFVSQLSSEKIEIFFYKYKYLFIVIESNNNKYAYKDVFNKNIIIFFDKFDSVQYKSIQFNKNFEIKILEDHDFEYLCIGEDHELPFAVALDKVKEEEIDSEEGEVFYWPVENIYQIFVVEVLMTKYGHITNKKIISKFLEKELNEINN